ncbi:MAG TPA: hypothetical protein VLD37_03310 [Candidatus Bilamarchaeum sp.]|nr:hypothetical protein [Candidatus Bilamarchaeum sp.]
MVSNTARTTSSSKKDDKAKDGFRGKEILPPDKITADDIHRAMFNEFDMGCVAPVNECRTVCSGNEDFDHHLF